MYRCLIAFIAVTFIASTAHAQSDEGNRSRPDHRAPPEAALEACANSGQRDPCSFEGMRGDTVRGACEVPDDLPLVCRPEGGPPGPRLERQ